MLPETGSVQRQMQQFAEGIRHPAQAALPAGVELERMTVYRELFANNITNLLMGMFPVMSSLCGKMEWQKLVQTFYAQHACRTPYFPEVGAEFVAWLQQEATLPVDKPYLAGLAHYEQVELALSIAETDEPWPPAAANAQSDVLTATLVVSPLCWPLHYGYPVHRIVKGLRDVVVEETWLLAYRDEQDAVRVVESSAASVQLLSMLQTNELSERSEPCTGRQVLLSLAQTLQAPDPEAIIAFGQGILLTWQQQGIIVVV